MTKFFKSVSGKIKIDGKLYYLLSQGENGQVIELSKEEVAKIFNLSGSREEANLMKTANDINSLMVKHIRVTVISHPFV